MIPILFSIFSVCILVAEFWSGLAIIGWSGDKMVVERAKQPGPYWFAMVLHTIVGIAIPAFLWFVWFTL